MRVTSQKGIDMQKTEEECPEISVVVPCYNEEDGIGELVRRIDDSCALLGKSYEIVLVNDRSTDGTWNQMLLQKKEFHSLRLISLAGNHGHQKALTAGLHYCRGKEYIFILDADLQDPPELLTPMLELMENENADVVYGQRLSREGESFFKRVSAKIFYRTLSYFTDVNIPVDTGDFRLIKRKVLDKFLLMPEQARFIRGMISWIGFTQKPYPYHRARRTTGVTKYPFHKMMLLAVDAIVSFSVKPLKIGIFLGIGGCFMGFVLFIYSLVRWFTGHTISGWTSLACIILFIGSVQLFLLGIIGEYVGRIYIEAQGRPLFIVDEIVE